MSTTFKPTTPSRRHMSDPSFAEVTKFSPEKKLTVILKKTAGRNSYGKITVRHIGGGNKKKYRIIDFKRMEAGKPATVIGIEYDPNRTAYIALIEYEDGARSYIVAPAGLKDGDVIYSGADSDIKTGNSLPIANIPVGTFLHDIELHTGQGAQLMAKENGMAQVRLPSGEVRLVRLDCIATIGQVGNIEHENVKLGKAGKTRHRGIRPHVRGSVMNPCDHPHGGGEGRAPIGRPSPVTPWGKPTNGYKTRNKKARTNKFIVKSRNGK